MKLSTLVIWGTAGWMLAVTGVFYYLLWLQTASEFHPVEFLAAATGEQLFNAARTSATLLGVGGLGGAALIAYRKQDSTEGTLANERTSALHDRYTTAAEQLGNNESPAIRLAGVYALASLADDWFAQKAEGQRQVCIDLLCAYLRANAHTSDDNEANVREAILSTIKDRTRLTAGGGWHLSRLDLTDLDLTEVTLTGASLLRADISGTNLTRATLNRVTFTAGREPRDLFGEEIEQSMQSRRTTPPPRGPVRSKRIVQATLFGADFTGAKLQFAGFAEATRLNGAKFVDADLRGADLTLTMLAETTFSNAVLTGTTLEGARISSPSLTAGNTSADFSNADLTGANLRYAEIGFADFTGARLNGTDLRFTTLEHAILTEIEHNEHTMWPEQFTPPASVESKHKRPLPLSHAYGVNSLE
ncbi:pentapeptide repeat-containing protein [Rhodococcus sp. 06-156-3C]|uniref:pentapeptide repeat-containing protein n=1 Tax=Nocardiaceae TaxID=85025 RepID=UPI000691F296|nr:MULTISPECIES: pentapeptide repeat-containing protein [Rhodococcus]OZD18323.1 pentapeptide repeat-containing protein [Rhodococcus sp. 06-156-4C]OZD18921.1 pentapeptide repeat-containing protein [Rhodococcus sp. 06-156-3C]OZD22431.1 pentapeptide repeat-containing protein [Rhodococcus sp. 06-156-4a]OZD34015.1 pentapeptide repeat-containing protein [Rhodococcus sp. 06-156-3b]OZD38752.1 pentapeptide repeat-containing protein [Rhodococcus sp. 06-156-3]